MACLLAAPVLAQVMFERAQITITPAAPTAPEGSEPVPVVPRVPISFDIEVRSEDALRLEYIHTLNTLTDSTGVAIVFDAPSIAGLPRMQVYTPVDALFVTEEGVISQIYPNVTLSDLSQDVYSKEPIKAFLFLKAGAVASRAFLPRDTITGPMFYAGPPVLE